MTDQNNNPDDLDEGDDVNQPLPGDDSPDNEEDTVEGEGGTEPNRESSSHDNNVDDRILAAERRAAEADARARMVQEESARSRNQRDEDHRVALMTPDERRSYDDQRFRQQMQYELQATRFQTADMMDRASYQSKASNNKLYQKHEREVEQRLADLRKLGGNFDRETILHKVIGEHVLKTYDSGSATKQRKKGEENISKQRTQASSAKGNVHAMPSKNESEARRERLRNTFLGNLG